MTLRIIMGLFCQSVFWSLGLILSFSGYHIATEAWGLNKNVSIFRLEFSYLDGLGRVFFVSATILGVAISLLGIALVSLGIFVMANTRKITYR